tara:strand:+ start:473 stop:1417 length:945 start_codon:yes stop_codon:yes gene_type:complete
MKYLITGGAGFIGSNLCQRLIDDGEEVVCLDNFYCTSKEKIKTLIDSANFELIEHDVVESYDISSDFVINLACPASPINYQKDPIKTFKTNILGSLNAVELAQKQNIPVLQASTSEIYGDPEVHPQREIYWGNVNPIGLRSCYDEGKRAAETLFYDYHRKDKLKIKIARLFNTYGPKMEINDGRAVSNFIVKSLKNEPLTIYGDGDNTRSFCYVSDTVDALIKFLKTNDDIIGPINIGNPTEMTINEIAEEIIKITNSTSEIIYSEPLLDDPKIRKPDINLANKILNWEPKVGLEQGLSETIKYFSIILNEKEN